MKTVIVFMLLFSSVLAQDVQILDQQKGIRILSNNKFIGGMSFNVDESQYIKLVNIYLPNGYYVVRTHTEKGAWLLEQRFIINRKYASYLSTDWEYKCEHKKALLLYWFGVNIVCRKCGAK